MGEVDSIELKFRIFDGTDIAHTNYASTTTVATLKERLVAQWPQGYGSHTKKEISYGSLSLEDKTVIPKSVNDVKLIYAGKVLENTKTLAESRIPFGDLPGGVTTMHVVVQPSLARKKTDKNHDDIPNPKVCSCTIL
ncbi:membrane-anchored ubiquitin-fold protein 3-like isoform X2 [Papaver somniferum]|uniref:membrane-anchored ubiquitin-fold protein 3-like isoform X2 n=1 Tax=Papaver somniferum TaxID=3469 RepID=UPI000E6FCECE|nr:membrane-anchored ubiquitin-fold protein 3-like isoform X2 [Papaver somniferum]